MHQSIRRRSRLPEGNQREVHRELDFVFTFRYFNKIIRKVRGMLEWHHLLGLTLKDFFTDSPYHVELEKDLSLKHQFSGIAEKAQYGASNYQWRRKDHSTVIKKLYHHYQVEGIAMPYTWNDFYREFTREHLDLLPAEDRLKGLPVEDRLKGLPVEAFLKRMPAAEIEAYLKKLRQKKRKVGKKA